MHQLNTNNACKCLFRNVLIHIQQLFQKIETKEESLYDALNLQRSILADLQADIHAKRLKQKNDMQREKVERFKLKVDQVKSPLPTV